MLPFEAQPIVEQLLQDCSFFGPGASIEWDGQFYVAEYTTPGGFTVRSAQSQVEFFSYLVPFYSEQGHVNIYFTGNVQANPPNITALATTVDPGQGAPQGVFPMILINDGGLNMECDFFGSFPGEFVRLRTILHETTHYLARFTNRTFNVPAPPRTYNSSEHIAIQNANNILRSHPQADPVSPLAIPGSYNQSGTEAYEIWNRISTGNWNNP